MGDVTSFTPRVASPDVYMPPPHALVRDDWTHRRVLLYITLAFFAGLLGYIVLANKANAVDQLVVPSLVIGIVSLVATYVFGMVWDYKSFMTSIATMSSSMPDARSEY